MQRAERLAFQASPSRCKSGHGCQFCSRSPTAEAQRRGRRQCRCKLPLKFRSKLERLSRFARLCREHHFNWAGSIKVMQRTFNPWNGEHYPGGPPFPSRLTSWTPDFGSGDRGAEPRSGAISKQTEMPVGVIATRLAYTQESGERNLHGQPSCFLRTERTNTAGTRSVPI